MNNQSQAGHDSTPVLAEGEGPYEGCFKAFYHFGNAYYGDNKRILRRGLIDKLTICFQQKYDGITTSSGEYSRYAEFNLTWKQFQDEIVLNLSVFSDALAALKYMPELVDYLAELDNTYNVSVEQVKAKLLSLGYLDITKRNQNSDPLEELQREFLANSKESQNG